MKKWLLGCLVWAGFAHAEVQEVRPEPGVDEKLAAAIQKSLDVYNALLMQELGVEMQKSARIDICPTEACYHNKLYDFGLRGADRDRTARSTGGIASGGQRRILVKLANAATLKRTNMLVAHELTHFVQSELSDSSARQPAWLHEGSAEFIAALVAQKMGTQSFEKWKLEVVNSLRRSEGYPLPSQLAEITNQSYQDWRELTDKTRGKNYQMASLMMAYLYEQKGRKLFDGIVGYYRCLSGSFTSEKTCFTRHFQVDPAQFYQEVGVWVGETLLKSGGLEVIANGQLEVGDEVGKNYGVAQALLEEKLGRKLDITMRILLSENKEEMAAQYAEELGLSRDEGVQRAGRNGGWGWQDSLAFIETGRVNMPEKRTRVLGQIAIGRYLQTRAGNMSKTYWLYSGLREWMSEQLLEKLGQKSRADLLAQRALVLDKAEKGVPALSELLTQEDWNKAVKKYGVAVVQQIALQGTESLLEKKGLPALAKWVDANRSLNGSPEAFAQAFGETQIAFAQSWASRVN